MSDLAGDIIGRGWRAGRAIGQDISEFRYNRGEAKLRETYANEAKQAGVGLEEYMASPDIMQRYESDLDQLYQHTGAKKRGVVGADGRSLVEGSRSAISADVARAGERRAATQVQGGDWEGANVTRGKVGGALGNYEAAANSRTAVEQIQTGKAAIGADGKVDNTKLAGGQARAAAGRGDVEGAAKASDAQNQFRMKTASQLAGTIAQMLDNPEQFGDQLRGTFHNLTQYLPELEGFDLQVDPQTKKAVIYSDGKPVGALDDPEEIRGMLEQFTNDPAGVLDTWKNTQLTIASQNKDRRYKIEDEVRGAQMDVIKKFGDAGVDGIKTQQLLEAQTKASNAGWRTLGTSDDGTVTAALGDRVVKILPAAPNGPNGQPGYASRMIDAATGQTINPKDLGEAGNAIAEYGIAMNVMQQDAAFQRNVGVLRMQLQLLDSMMGGDSAGSPDASGLPGAPKIGGALGSGGGNSRADRNNNPGNIEDGSFAKNLPGYKGSDGRFAIFDSPEAGQNAQVVLLRNYGRKGVDTVQGIINRWSPQSDPTNQKGSTNNYMNYVAQKLGVDPTEQLDMSDEDTLRMLASAMHEFESGNTDAFGGTKQNYSALPPKLDYQTGGTGYQPPAPAAPQVAASGLPAPLNYVGGGEIGTGTGSGAPLPSMPGGGAYKPTAMDTINNIARTLR